MIETPDASGRVYRPIEVHRDPVPAWLLVLAALVLVGAGVYLLTNLAPPPGTGGPGPGSPGASHDPGGGVDSASAMALIEEAGCQGCHGDDLSGQGTFPSLHGVGDGPVSDNLQELGASHPEDWANLWIAGDAPEVAGLERRGMPAFAGSLTPEEIQIIVEYLKSL